MSKKESLAAAPRPKTVSEEDVAKYVATGAGHDTTATGVMSTGEKRRKEKGETKRLSLELSPQLHKRFKTACSAYGVSMTDQTIKFIEEHIGELEEKAGLAVRS